MKTKTGIIIGIQANRGFGFIQDEEGHKIFFHASGVIDPSFKELKEGNMVEYFETNTQSRNKAIGIVVMK